MIEEMRLKRETSSTYIMRLLESAHVEHERLKPVINRETARRTARESLAHSVAVYITEWYVNEQGKQGKVLDYVSVYKKVKRHADKKSFTALATIWAEPMTEECMTNWLDEN
jgi:predicted RNA binding protein with dsRBD fold (UPF0201 family)